MPETYWDLIFDLHGVLADVSAVNRNYGNYLEKVLVPTGMKREEVVKIHEFAFKNWIEEITRLTNEFDESEEWSTNSEVFMRKYNLIDIKWEKFILESVPLEHKNGIKPLLKTSIVEYEALAKGSYPILYSEVKSVLTELVKINHLRMHIASSASSCHVKGAVARHNLKDFFQELIGYDTVKAPKKAITPKRTINGRRIMSCSPPNTGKTQTRRYITTASIATRATKPTRPALSFVHHGFVLVSYPLSQTPLRQRRQTRRFNLF